MDGGFTDLLACPVCGGGLTPAFDCTGCGAHYSAHEGIPDFRLDLDTVSDSVRRFYEVAPFPGYPPHDSLTALRSRALRSAFITQLDREIPLDARIVEIGCGTGQTSLFLARGQRVVIGVDMADASLRCAAAARRRFGVDQAIFIASDLHRPALRPGAFDIVLCSGVLHHTAVPRAAFRSVARLLGPGGILVLGLYNSIARLPLRLRRLIARASGFRVIPFDPVLRERRYEPERRAAWIRDQYQHPKEHRHTLHEVQQWLVENGLEYLRAYPSAVLGDDESRLFTPAADNWRAEGWLAQIGWMAKLGHEGGLFIVIGRRPAARNPTISALPSASMTYCAKTSN
jgi:SAM-dependent methyltransferase